MNESVINILEAEKKEWQIALDMVKGISHKSKVKKDMIDLYKKEISQFQEAINRLSGEVIAEGIVELNSGLYLKIGNTRLTDAIYKYNGKKVKLILEVEDE